MKTILIIGIGAGDPDYITVQAIKALNRVDVFFLMDKGPAKAKLRALREELCRLHIKDHTYRFVEAPSPPRDTAPADYRVAVDALNREKQAVFERMIVDDYWETGASGRRYDRAFVLDVLERRHAVPHDDPWETSDFRCRALGARTWLLTYTLQQGERLSRRMTLWREDADGWRALYHQGTLVQDAAP